MAYPKSPFEANFDTELIRKSQCDDAEGEVESLKLIELLEWLSSTPKISSYRVNTLRYSTENVLLEMRAKLKHITDYSIIAELSPYLSDVIVVNTVTPQQADLNLKPFEVIIDVYCAAAVLRGAHIFAPGVIGMQLGVKVGDHVSIYADLENKCKRGFRKTFTSNKKTFIGNGIVKQTRQQLFGENLNPSGVAVQVYSNIAGCILPSLDMLSTGSCLLQNLPSIICTLVLHPQPGETVLDMCAAPGNKTTHIAALMKNEGTIIAIDKVPSKITQLKQKCTIFDAKNVLVYLADATKILIRDEIGSIVTDGPPFTKECFDRILLDAPCSVLGKRPQLRNNTSEKVIKSFVPLQRKLFVNAVNLLKINGYLVYSTCTITQAENEGIVAWALETFKCLKLCRSEPYLGEPGWPTRGLSSEDLSSIQRFGVDSKIDSIGFFIALFVKHSPVSPD